MAEDGHIILRIKTKIDDGVSSAVKSLKSKFRSAADTADLLNQTANAIQANRERIAELEQEYSRLVMKDSVGERAESLRKTIDALKGETDDLTKAMESFGKKTPGSIEKTTSAFKKFASQLANTVKRVFVFQVLYKTLREIKELFADVLFKDDQIKNDWNELKAAFKTAIVPLIEIVSPYIGQLLGLLRDFIVLLGQFTANLAGISYEEMLESSKELSAGTEEASANLESADDEAKNLSRTLAGFDDIQILDSGNDSESSIDDELAAYSRLIEKGKEGGDTISEIESRLNGFSKFLSGAFLALGVILLFTGNIGWGVGLIIAGVTVSRGEDSGTDTDGDAKAKIENLMSVISTSLMAIGLILLLTGNIGWGVGLIISGATAAGVAEGGLDMNWFSENCDLILNFLEGVATYLVVKRVASLFSGLVSDTGKLGENASGASNGMSKLSRIFSGNGSIELWATSISVLVTGIKYFAENAGKLSSVQKVVTILGSVAAAAGAAAIAIALFHTTWTVGVAAAAIVGGIGLLAGTYLFKKFNANTNSVTSAVNGDGSGAPSSISKYSSMASGKTFALPALADGAVLPANKPFLAIVGDQKNGTNIEAPLDTIKEAVRSVFNEKDDGIVEMLGEILTTICAIKIGDDTIGKAANRYNASLVKINGG